ncbi:MAG: hypothetical protein GEU98_04830 [Pseudonocardiaceae bacterium]|nr:hypothetical protein [Pseudonocardiaceae bacterium]
MQVFHVEQTIDRPVDQVWKTLTDWDDAAAWMAHAETVSADGDTVPGTTVSFHTRGKTRTSTITAVDPGRSTTLTSTQGGVTADYTYTVQPTGEQTTVALTVDCATRGLWRLAEPALHRFMRKADSGQLQALQRHIERDRR